VPKVKKATKADLELIHRTALRGLSVDAPSGQSPTDDNLRITTAAHFPTDEDPVSIDGATLQDFRLTPRGFGYELKILIPLDQEEKLPALRRLAFQRLVTLDISPCDSLMWDEDDD